MTLRPTIPTTIQQTNATRATVADSSDSTMPSVAVSTAPIPVQTAYAVPIGKF